MRRKSTGRDEGERDVQGEKRVKEAKECRERATSLAANHVISLSSPIFVLTIFVLTIFVLTPRVRESACACACACMCACVRAYARAYARARARMHARVHARVRMHMRVRVRMHVWWRCVEVG